MARFVLLWTLVLLGFWPHPALAEKRVALAIGNGAYQHVDPLPNPPQDAKAIADLLKKAGFEVVQARTDVGNLDFKRALQNFEDLAEEADIAVVFYAGHAIEIGGENYMIPVDAKLEKAKVVEDETVSLERLFRAVAPAKSLRLVILDACRDNPFLGKMQFGRSQTRQIVSHGLAKVETTLSDTLIAYAASPGSTADDGDGDHSPYTTALLKNLAEPGIDIRVVFGGVRDDVRKLTHEKQEPYVTGSLGRGNIFLVPAPAAPASLNSKADDEMEERLFRRLQAREAAQRREEREKANRQPEHEVLKDAEAKRKAEAERAAEATTPPSCSGGMILIEGSCACPPAMNWNGRACVGTGGINTTPQPPEAEQAAEAKRKAEAELASAEAKRKAEAEQAAEAKRKAEAVQAAEAKRKAEAELASAEAKRKADAEAAEAKRKSDKQRAQQEAEAKRKADAEAAEAKRKADAEAAEEKRKGDEQRAQQEAEAKRKAEAEAAEAKRKADAVQAAEAKRKTEAEQAAEATRNADDPRVQQEAEAKRKADAEQAAEEKRKADEQRAQQEAEAKRKAEAEATEAKQKAEQEQPPNAASAPTSSPSVDSAAADPNLGSVAEATRPARVETETGATPATPAPSPPAGDADKKTQLAAIDLAQSPTDLKPLDATDDRSHLPIDGQRIEYLKQVQTALKGYNCYEGTINGDVDDARAALNRFATSYKGVAREVDPTSATIGDYEEWLKWAKGLEKFSCPSEDPSGRAERTTRKKVQKPAAERERRPPKKEARRSTPNREARRQPRSSPSRGSGGSPSMGGTGF